MSLPTDDEMDEAIATSSAEADRLARQRRALEYAGRIMSALLEGAVRAAPYLLEGLSGDEKADGRRVAEGLLRNLTRHVGPLPEPS